MVVTLRSGREVKSGKEEKNKRIEKVKGKETGIENKLSSSNFARETEKEKVPTKRQVERE